MTPITVDPERLRHAAARAQACVELAEAGAVLFASNDCIPGPPRTALALSELEDRLLGIFEGLAELARDVSLELEIVADAHDVMDGTR
jgi:hypothetical protein